MASDRLPSSTNDEPQIITTTEFSIWNTFKRHIPHFLATALVDVVFPLIIYFTLQKHVKPVYALLIAGIPPFTMVLCKAIISRTFDALGFMVFLGFVISGVVAIVTKNAIILLLEKSLITGILSLIFAITLIPLHCCHNQCKFRPIAYYFYQDLVPTNRQQIGLPENLFISQTEYSEEEQVLIPKLSERDEIKKVYEWIYAHCSSFRSSCYIITSIWSIGLLFEFLARLTLILMHLSINKIFLYGNIILTTITVICTLGSIICLAKERKQTFKLIEQWKKEHLNIQ